MTRFLITFFLLLHLPVLAAETFVSKQINAQNRLIPLQKITVGPDDQYQASVDPSGTTLVYTKKSDLVPHLCSQSLATGDVTDLLPLSADSQEAAISPDRKLVFTYYKFNARGDICYRLLEGKEDQKINCLKAEDGERSAPFWKSANEIGYVVRNMKTLESKIVAQNIDTETTQVLAEGKVWSPAMKPGGRYLFYNELVYPTKPSAGNDAPVRALVMKDLQTGKTKPLHFLLPGISGFPSVSKDEKNLFFSHYLDDTNHDNVIDANDNAVVFRASIDDLLKNDTVFPEQLTSTDSNCSYPRAYEDQLYVTCAFEGSLDVYRLPVTGVVPSQWDEKLMLSAHETARTYQERILILNSLKFRLGNRGLNDIDERVLGNHLLEEDTTAAKYYLKALQVAAQSKDSRREFHKLLRLYLDALERKNSEPSQGQVSSSFQKDILAIDAEVAKVKGYERFQKIVRGLLRTFLNQPKQSAAFLKQVRFTTPGEPLERYYFFELANWTLPRLKSHEGLLAAYREMMTAPELTEESRVFYAFHFLQYVGTGSSIKERIHVIGRFNHDLKEPVASLLISEVATLEVIDASDPKGKDQAYRELDKLMSASRSDYFLRKALYVRAILNFADAADFQHLNFIANNWLKYTTRQDTEYAYARDVFVNATLDRAYDNFAQKKFQLAGDYFYGSLSLTDDLESHFGYIVSLVANNQRQLLDVRYQNLKQRQFIDDNMKFVQALLLLIDAHSEERRDTKALNGAIENLTSMEQDRDSPVRYLLLGYCYLDKLLRTSDGYDFDAALLENAHRSLMLAYDLGRDNARIRAAALMDLGLLHQRVQNYALAAQFFSKRKELGFVSNEDGARFGWFYARSLFYANQPDKAVAEIEDAMRIAPAKYQVPFTERRAFYLHAARSYAEAADAYRKLFASHQISGDLNLAKAYLAYGFSLFKSRQEPEAKDALNRSIACADRLKLIEKGGDRAVDFQPMRLKLDAYGLLSRMGTPTERLAALEKRGLLLDEAHGLYEDWLSLAIENRLQMAKLYSATDPARAAAKMGEAIQFAEQLGDSGQYLSRAVFQATSDYLMHAFAHPQLYRQGDSGKIRQVVQKNIKAYDSQRQTQPVWDFQKRKIKMLWAGYSAKVLKDRKLDPREILDLAKSSTLNSKELISLANALTVQAGT